ncbi:cupin domain-containing protein [Amycolatopsis sp. PS_44_ISF1]|uniref:cupin domain-containing protein n=1 Tax=Amycolatopsis sp. PS_44_ISF1 TaxID=2974917 RepID=UPI0028DDBBDC|nr:cupin domain-containing protein [Amycolatopsis sp. PS_44_ISF1]MDT8912359.1 cupin domain-containing protein [Amycolatopsis sp. PS_44_ISF1]
MLVDQGAVTGLTYQNDYNVHAQRLTRLRNEPYEGGAWVRVDPGDTMTEHVNPGGETEIFYFFEGTGRMTVAGETTVVAAGDTVLVPPGARHLLTNHGGTPLLCLALWWGGETHLQEGTA